MNDPNQIKYARYMIRPMEANFEATMRQIREIMTDFVYVPGQDLLVELQMPHAKVTMGPYQSLDAFWRDVHEVESYIESALRDLRREML